MRTLLLSVLVAAAAACGGTSSTTPDAGEVVDAGGVDGSTVDAASPDALVSTVCDGVTPPVEPPPPALVPFACDSVVPSVTRSGTQGELTVSAGGAANGRALGPRTCVASGDTARDTTEVVIGLSGLTSGARYTVSALGATPQTVLANVGVLTGCDEGATTASCALARPMVQRFVAPASGRVRIVVEPSSSTGSYVVRWNETGCVADRECGPAASRCSLLYGCVECVVSNDCADPARPVCTAAGACVAGPVCATADDPAPPGGFEGPDDGPVHGRPVTAPVLGAPPVVVDGIACAGDSDHVRLTVPAGTPAVRLGSSSDAVWMALETGPRTYLGQTILVSLPPGTYPLNIYNSRTTPYQVSVTAAACASHDDCGPAAPHCGNQGSCGPVPAGPACPGEADPAEPGDDGRAGATPIDVAPDGVGTAHARICDVNGEHDWFRVVVADGDRLDVELESDVGADLDLKIVDATGQRVAEGTTPLGCELVHAAALPAGTYYLDVRALTRSTTPIGYTITARRSREPCADSASCVALTDRFGSTYRATCDAGACRPISAAGQSLHAACDSGDDCASERCTPPSTTGPGECTIRCVDDTSCLAVGDGYACTGFILTDCARP